MPNSTIPTLQIYRVGGSIRDELLGLPAGDRDWVVVGATPEQMLAQGFRAVGKDFPVFLHPKTHEEYALARTERKTGPGYKGFAVHFSPDVTLEEDLLRRDLTINAIAQGPVDVQKEGTRMDNIMGSLIDPFNGRADIEARIFRHISPAFREDPVRILRVARFAARFPEFSVAPETLALMQEMSAAGEVHALVAERVWQEISRGLTSAKPSRMLQVLADAHALQILIPALPDPATQPAWLAALDASAAAGDPLPVRFSILLAGMGAGDESAGGNEKEESAAADLKTAVAEQARALRASNDCIDAASRLATEISGPIPQAALQWFASPERKDPAKLVALFNRHDAWRRPERLQLLLTAAQRLASAPMSAPTPISASTSTPAPTPAPASTPASTPKQERATPGQLSPSHGADIHAVCAHIGKALLTAQAVDTGAIARQHQHSPATIRQAIDTARCAAISAQPA